MNNQQREETSEIRSRRVRKEENEIRPSWLHSDPSFPAETHKIQSDDQSVAVRSYPALAANASAQADPISSTSPIRRTATRTRSQSAVLHYKDAAADDIDNEEQVIDAENPAFRQSPSIIYNSNAKSHIPEETIVEITSMHEQHGTPVSHQTSKMSTSQDVEDFENPSRLHSCFQIYLDADSAPVLTMEQKALLCQAALTGDWNSAEAILRKHKGFASLPITQSDDRLLHIAAGAKQTKFVRELVEFMSEDYLALTNKDGNTAFCFAAASGVVEIAEIMYEWNNELPIIRGGRDTTPLHIAALLRKKEMVSYLYKVTPLQILNPEELNSLFEATINIEMFDLALNMWNETKRFTDITVETKLSALNILARRPSLLTSNYQKWTWRRFLSIIRILQYIPWMKRIHDDSQKEMGADELFLKLLRELWPLSDPKILDQIIDTDILYDAAKEGNVKLLAILLRECPELILRLDHDEHTIFHIAVLHRQEKVFNLIQDLGVYQYIVASHKDKENNNILHLAGRLAKERRLEVVSGAALQLQRELQWFKEVEKVVLPSFLEDKNDENQTPGELFSKTHESLLKEGEKWMKDTANSCMLVATLIATVVFAAAFTAPGGSNDDTGVPILLKARWFEVFVISDAVAMVSSTTSIIIFLSILTSRYALEDFLASLPGRLMFGLTALFLSILSMVVAFVATFFLIYNGVRVWMPKLIGGLACIPVFAFALLQYKLWIDTIRSAYWSKFMFRPSMYKFCQLTKCSSLP